MDMVCYGGPPVERWETCATCDGEGFVNTDWHIAQVEDFVFQIVEMCAYELDSYEFSPLNYGDWYCTGCKMVSYRTQTQQCEWCRKKG